VSIFLPTSSCQHAGWRAGIGEPNALQQQAGDLLVRCRLGIPLLLEEGGNDLWAILDNSLLIGIDPTGLKGLP
jgi:hypothetical protein